MADADTTTPRFAGPLARRLRRWLLGRVLPRHYLLVAPAFDAAYYRRQVPGLPAGVDPLEHFLLVGWREGRDPNPLFSTRGYLAENEDVAAAGFNPIVHHLLFGAGEGRRAVPADDGVDLSVETRPGRRTAPEGAPRVLVCGHVSGPHRFGSERSFLDILDGLSAAGLGVLAALPAAGGAYEAAVLDRVDRLFLLPYGWWRAVGAPSAPVVRAFRHLVRDHGVDVVHANTIMLREPLLAARREGVAAVVHAREIVGHDPALAAAIGLAPAEIVAEVVARADWVIANSAATAAAYDTAGRTLVVPNAVEVEALALPPPAMAGGLVRFGLVSSNVAKKGLDDLVAVARLAEAAAPNARFLAIGPETETVRAIEAAGAPANLAFPGYAESPHAALEGVDVVLNLSRFAESFGRTVAEAMAAGRPVVAYRWGALPELVVDGETGFLVPYADPSAAAAAVARLAADPALVRRMGEAGRARAVALYGPEAFAKAITEAYRPILAERTALAAAAQPATTGVSGRPPHSAHEPS